MRDQPTGAQLLHTARQLLRDELLPALPPPHRHAALMIANAMAIAARQLQQGDAAEREELLALQQLLSLPPCAAADDPSALRGQLVAANRLLSVQVREGQADDGEMRARVLAHLRSTTRRKVEESNPKVLAPPSARALA